MILEGEGASHTHTVFMMEAAQRALNAFQSRIFGESVVLLSDSHCIGILEEAKGNSFQGHVQFFLRDHGLVGTEHGDSDSEVHSEEEHHHRGPVEKFRSGSFPLSGHHFPLCV